MELTSDFLGSLAASLREQARSLLEQADFIDRKAMELPAGDTFGTMELRSVAVIHQRRRKEREKFFPKDLISGEIAWDMLVELFIAGIDRRPVTVSSLCYASGGPIATAHRYVGLLETMGLIEKIHSEKDQRLIFIRLTVKAETSVNQYFSAVLAGQTPATPVSA